MFNRKILVLGRRFAQLFYIKSLNLTRGVESTGEFIKYFVMKRSWYENYYGSEFIGRLNINHPLFFNLGWMDTNNINSDHVSLPVPN